MILETNLRELYLGTVFLLYFSKSLKKTNVKQITIPEAIKEKAGYLDIDDWTIYGYVAIEQKSVHIYHCLESPVSSSSCVWVTERKGGRSWMNVSVSSFHRCHLTNLKPLKSKDLKSKTFSDADKQIDVFEKIQYEKQLILQKLTNLLSARWFDLIDCFSYSSKFWSAQKGLKLDNKSILLNTYGETGLTVQLLCFFGPLLDLY